MSEPEKLRPLLGQANPWANNDNSVWLASTLNLYRNFEKFKFPNKLELERRKQVINFVSKELLSQPQLINPILIKAEEIGPLEKELLVEHFLSNQSYNQAHIGEAFVIDDTGQFLASINLQEHLCLELIDSKGELEMSWNKLVKIETDVGKNVPYAFSPKFGFLTAEAGICGTGLIISNYLQLPALVHTEKLEDAIDKYLDENIALTGIQGNPTEMIGDVLVIQNHYTVGLTEENIFSAIRSFSTKLLVEENAARNAIRHSQNPEIKDKVSRSFGILIHSYQIEAVEALNALSLIKLGAELGWISGISIKELNQLFFNCRRSHLLKQLPEKIVQEDIIHKRAEFIHQSLKKVQLTI